jgi:multiple sugar transport system permease protein
VSGRVAGWLQGANGLAENAIEGVTRRLGAAALAWPHLMAASTVTVLPIIVLFFLAQRTFIEGIAISGIKG